MKKRIFAALLSAFFIMTLLAEAFLPVEAATSFRTKPMIEAGYSHTVLLKEEGTVWVFGRNNSGQLGDGTTANHSTPVQVKNLSNAIAIAAGGSHTVLLKEDGTVWALGNNKRGQLGDGTTDDRYTPVQVKDKYLPLINVIAIAAGGNHTVALKEDGTVWAWGEHESGQLGDGENYYPTRCITTPVQVKNLSNVIAIAAGNNHTVALKDDGTVWVWGDSDYGQLGIVDRRTPVQVKDLSNVIAIAAGYDHTVALKSDGTVWAWGCNDYGQLGDGTTANHSTPVQVKNLINVIAIAAGIYHSVALKEDGTVCTWGYNGYGQLGDGTTSNSNVPKQSLANAYTTYTISYNANGGTNAPSAQTKRKGESINLSKSIPTRTGYTFKGWSTTSSGSVEYASGAVYSKDADVTLYAVWEPLSYTITYNLNGGSGTISSQTKIHGQTINISSTKPTRSGYTFKGWATSSTGAVQYAPGATYSKDASITLYAVWEKEVVVPTHNWDTDYTIDKQPTCTENGSKSIHCSHCNEVKDTQVILALGHNYSNTWTVDKAATCTGEGSQYHYCTRCGVKGEVSKIPALGHNYSSSWTIDQAATCTTNGSQSHHCTRCGVKTDVTVIPAAHQFGAWEVIEGATCSGKESKKRTCSICQFTETDIPADADHVWEGDYTVDKDATCTEDGSQSIHCARCVATKDSKVIPATGHSWIESTRQDATCTDAGWVDYVCQTDSSHTYRDTLPATNHEWEDDFTIDREPTDSEEGRKSIHCKNCDEVKDVTVIPAGQFSESVNPPASTTPGEQSPDTNSPDSSNDPNPGTNSADSPSNSNPNTDSSGSSNEQNPSTDSTDPSNSANPSVDENNIPLVVIIAVCASAGIAVVLIIMMIILAIQEKRRRKER